MELLPRDDVLARFVFGSSLHADELHIGGVGGNRNLDFYLLGLDGWLEVGLEDDFVVHRVLLVSLRHHRVDSEWKGNVIRRSVFHQFKLAVRRDEADGPFGLELAQLDTLVECTVVYRYASLIRCPTHEHTQTVNTGNAS